MAIDATVGGLNANSYISIIEADVYVGNRLGLTHFSSANLSVKESSLIQATELLDRYVDWYGYVASNVNQRLRWPRWNVYNRDNWYVSANVIPEDIKGIVVEVADWLIKHNGLSVDTVTTSEVVVGGRSKGISIKNNVNRSLKGFPRSIMIALEHWGRVNLVQSGAISTKLERA